MLQLIVIPDWSDWSSGWYSYTTIHHIVTADIYHLHICRPELYYKCELNGARIMVIVKQIICLKTNIINNYYVEHFANFVPCQFCTLKRISCCLVTHTNTIYQKLRVHQTCLYNFNLIFQCMATIFFHSIPACRVLQCSLILSLMFG